MRVAPGASRSDAIDELERLRRELGGPPALRFPRDWTYSAAWKRAQQVSAVVEPDRPTGFWVTFKEQGASTHRVLFAVLDGDVRARCDCKGYQYHDRWCSHVAAIWWLWSRGRATVWDCDGRAPLEHPPAWLRLEDEDAEADERRLRDRRGPARASPPDSHGGGADAPLTFAPASSDSSVSHTGESES